MPSVRHEFILHWIIEKLKEKGYGLLKANKSAGPDIEVTEANTAIEIELGKSNMQSNIIHDMQKFSRVIVISDQKKVSQVLSAKTKGSRVLFMPVQKVPAAFEKKYA